MDTGSQIDLFDSCDKYRNGYLQLYRTLIHVMREKPLNILEIGIWTMIPNSQSSIVGYSFNEYNPGLGLGENFCRADVQ